MPDLSGIPAVDVAIGLAFLFFLLSIVCSSINEGIAVVLRLRARTLEHGIVSLLGDRAKAHEFYEHWRIQALMRPVKNGQAAAAAARVAALGELKAKQAATGLSFGEKVTKARIEHKVFKRRPSYMPSRVFALTLIDSLRVVPTADAAKKAEDAVAAALKKLEAEKLPEGVHSTLLAGLDALKANLESESGRLTDEAMMSRVRQALTEDTQRLAAAQAAAAQPAGDAPGTPFDQLESRVRGMLLDALAAGTTDVTRFRQSLERSFDEVMDRASGWYKRRTQFILFFIGLVLAVVINADSYNIARQLWTDQTLRAAIVAQADQTLQTKSSSTCATPATAASGSTPSETPVERASDCLDKLRLNLPIGWSRFPAWRDVPGKIAGLLITAFALTLGAPFWFDLLGKVSQLRGSGPAQPGGEQKAEQSRKAPAPSPTAK